MCCTARYCSAALCGSDLPAAFHAIMVSPEQSQVFGPAAPKTYFSLSCAHAKSTTLPPAPATVGAAPYEVVVVVVLPVAALALRCIASSRAISPSIRVFL